MTNRTSSHAQTAITALCCTCGTQRTTRTIRRPGRVGEPAGLEEYQQGAPRCVVDLKCATCGEITRHAFLRQGEYADVFEQAIIAFESGYLFWPGW